MCVRTADPCNTLDQRDSRSKLGRSTGWRSEQIE